tara:strand:+ start:1798 stop:2301 length:504 start_codon:yes stop_codon:yes gene_type:complete
MMKNDKYQNGKIYKIVNDTLNLTYYGSTIQKYLNSRFYMHKKEKDNKKYSSYKLFESGETKIFLVELYPCNSKLELEKRERFYIENNECVNMTIPTRTNKEWRDDNKDKLKQYKKDYYVNNKEHCKAKSKINYFNNRDEQLKKNQIRYQLNKDKYNETRRLKYQHST